MSLKNRIETLESKVADESTVKTPALFMATASARIGAEPPGPVIGWTYNGHEIRRADGESDADLEARAIQTVQPTLRGREVPIFFGVYK